MNRLFNKALKKMGYAVLTKRLLKYRSTEEIKSSYTLNDADVAYIRGKLDGGLKEKLTKENKKRWLDVGSGGNLDEEFYYVDTFPESLFGNNGKYFRLDIINANDFQLERLGKFDLIRMQHVFEHFTPEDGIRVLNNCAKLLNKDGYILITTPDLRRFVHMYLSGTINRNDWSLTRVAKDAPESFYFSVFAHSLLHEQHKWCYDAEGLLYQLNSTVKFYNVREIKLSDDLANIPFTHNRPDEDVCVMGQLK